MSGPHSTTARIQSILNGKAGKALLTLGDQGLVSLVNFSAFFLLARKMAELEFGLFALALTVIVVATGFQQALIGSAFQVKAARRTGASLTGFTTAAFVMQAVLSVLVLLLAVLGWGVALAAGAPDTAFLILCLGLVLGPWMAQDLMRKSFYTLGRAGDALINDLVAYGLQMAGILWLIQNPAGAQAWSALAVYGAASAAAVLVGVGQMRGLLSLRALGRWARFRVDLRVIWRHGRWIAGSQIWRQLGVSGHTWIITAILGPVALGAYRAATHLINVLNPIEMAIGLWFPPEASRRYDKGGGAAVKAWFRRVAPVLLIPTAVAAVIFLAFPRAILELAYPGKYLGMGLHWIVALAAVSRLLNFGRNLYHNALLSSDRPKVSVGDAVLSVVIKYGIGIPAVLAMGLLGAPAASLTAAVATLAFNYRAFRRIPDLRGGRREAETWETVGNGAEGVVYRDRGPDVVTKVYKDDEAVDEAWRYYVGLLAASEHVDQSVVSTPEPLEFEPDIPLIQMRACSGESIRKFVCGPEWHPEQARRVARRVWLGMVQVPQATSEPTYDLWPDNLLYDPAGDRVTFVDFVAGDDVRVDADGSMSAQTLGGFLGHALYDLVRPSHCFRIRDIRRIRHFCALLWEEALRSGESAKEIRSVADALYERVALRGGPARTFWYRHAGGLLYRLHGASIYRKSPNTNPGGTRMVCHYMVHFPQNGERTANGIHKAVQGLASGLEAAGVPNEIVCEHGVRCSWTMQGGVDVHAFRAAIFPGFRLAHGLRDHVERMPERTLFVLHGQFTPRLARFGVMLRRMGRPYVVMPHTLYSDAVFAKNRIAKEVYWRLVERRLLRKAAMIQLLEADQAQPLRARGVNTPVAIVPNAVNPERTLPTSTLSWSNEGPVRLYYLGRINFHQKALDLLVRAVARVRHEFDIRLTIQGPDAGDLEALRGIAAETGAAEVLEILPPDFGNESVDLMSRYDVFCMPSRVEGFPMAALEAMQAGRPLLFTNVSGLSEAVRASGCGVLVSPQEDDVVRGIRELCARRDEFRDMGLSGHRYVNDHYSPDAVAEIAAEAYEDAMPPRSRRSGHALPGDVAPVRPPAHPVSSPVPVKKSRAADDPQGGALP